MLRPESVLAIYVEGALQQPFAKMGLGVLRFSPHRVAAVIDSEFAGRDARDVTGIPRPTPIVATLEQAKSLGANVLVLGIAPPGGLIPEAWLGVVDRAVELGMSIVNGLHDLLGPRYPHLATGQFVWDVRVEPAGLGNGTAKALALPNRRCVFLGTDMAIGKMTAGLEVLAAAREAGVRAEFVATGQIGITIVGNGVPLDAVRVDFATGAIEREVLRYPDADLVLVEGQGSIIHPASTSTLPLLRGTCPTHLILCHRAGQTSLLRMPEIRIPPLPEVIRLYEDIAEACGTYTRPKTAGVALNTFHLDDRAAAEACRELEAATGLLCVDPVRDGASRLLEALMA